MEKQQIDMWVMSNNDKLLPEQMSQIRSKLEQISEDKLATISFTELNSLIKLKSPTTMLIISILLGNIGVDRFMLGHKRMGILKLLTLGCIGILTIIRILNRTVSEIREIGTLELLLKLGCLGLGCAGILIIIIDWFRVQKMTKNYNFRKIMNILDGINN